MTDPISEPDPRMAAFATALGELCRRHGVMIWTASDTTPIMATPISDDDEFHYEAVRLDIRTTMIRRVLPLKRSTGQDSE